MSSAIRKVAFVVFALAVFATTGCGGNAKKIVGKWKMESVTKDGKDQKANMMGMTLLMEFTADGNLKGGIDANSIPEEFKKMFEANKDELAKMTEMKQLGKYKVSGDTIEFIDMEKSKEKDKDSPFGKSNKGKLKFEGDALTITGDDISVKFTKVK